MCKEKLWYWKNNYWNDVEKKDIDICILLWTSNWEFSFIIILIILTIVTLLMVITTMKIIELIQTGVISFCNQVSPGLSMVILRSFSEGRRNFWNRRVGSGVKDLNLIETVIPKPAGLMGDNWNILLDNIFIHN